MKKTIAVIAGDGIGPEIVGEAVMVLKQVAEKFGHDFEFDEKLVGGAAYDACGDCLPDATLAACRSADAVLLSNRLDSLTRALPVARRTRRIIIENLSWAMLYNGLILPFAAVGWVTPAWAALGMSISSLLVVVNALRLARQPAEAAH